VTVLEASFESVAAGISALHVKGMEPSAPIMSAWAFPETEFVPMSLVL